MSNLSELLPSGGGQNQVEFVASGTLPNGKPVILKSNGQVEVVSQTTITEVIPLGSEVVFAANQSRELSVSFDPSNANKFVVAYRDIANSSYGTAVVGTTSGTSITFGSEYVFSSAGAGIVWTSISFDPTTAGKFVIAFQDAGTSEHGTVMVGTVSGTTLSFGSKYVFNSASTSNIAISLDPLNSGKFVVVYRDDANSDYGTAVVGTVSGTSISFGSEYNFNGSSEASYNSIDFDSLDSGKFVISYRDHGNSSYGTAIVGTVSGNSISFGSEVVFNAGATYFTSISFDPSAVGKLVIAYKDVSNSNYGSTVVGTVSGTSISFGSEVVFNSAGTSYISVSIDPSTSGKFAIAYTDLSNWTGKVIIGTVSGTSSSFGTASAFNGSGTATLPTVSFDSGAAGKFVIAYRDDANSGKGTAIQGQMGTAETNLTSTNLIGISAAAASSGATAKINTWGGINEAQSSLTIASDYYVQTDGTITTATGGQKVGQAISATTINMRNQP